MASHVILQNFYKSDAWRNFRAFIISERGPVCESCHKVIAKPIEIELDHYPVELTPENVSDTLISLNPENVKVLCHGCHNIRHQRFSRRTESGVYIVYGPPLSGKKTLVRQQMQRGDLVVDMDRLCSAISLLPDYDKPDNLLGNVRAIHNTLIDNIKTRFGKWRSAWVIGGYADKYRREKLANDLGAELVFCDVSKEECLRRLEADPDRRLRRDEWQGYIEKWFEEYRE